MFRRTALLVAILFCADAYAESGQLLASLGECRLTSGRVIEDCRVGYRTYGVMNLKQNNVLVVPTWFTGTTGDFERLNTIGPGRVIDTDGHFVVTIDAFGNGVSSSPSNSEKQPGKQFPAVSIEDMVHSQYRLLTEHLDIHHVKAMIGISMGGMQTLEWIGRYPEFMDSAVPIVGSPKMTSYDLLQWRTHKNVILIMQRAGSSREDMIDVLSSLSQLTLRTPGYLVENVSPNKLGEFLAESKAMYSNFDSFNYILQVEAMLGQDVFGPTTESRQRYIDSIQAELLVVGSNSDHMVNPTPARKLATVLGGKYFAVDSNCGHLGTVCEADTVAARIGDFLLY